MPHEIRRLTAAILICSALFAACAVESGRDWGFALRATTGSTRLELHAIGIRFAFIYEHQCPESGSSCGAHA